MNVSIKYQKMFLLGGVGVMFQIAAAAAAAASPPAADLSHAGL